MSDNLRLDMLEDSLHASRTRVRELEAENKRLRDLLLSAMLDADQNNGRLMTSTKRAIEKEVEEEPKFAKRGPYCETCGSGTQNINVHHKTYARLGKELAEDLEILCQMCHEIRHGILNHEAHAKATIRKV